MRLDGKTTTELTDSSWFEFNTTRPRSQCALEYNTCWSQRMVILVSTRCTCAMQPNTTLIDDYINLVPFMRNELKRATYLLQAVRDS